MRNYNLNQFLFRLFALLFISVNIYADYQLSGFELPSNLYKQDSTGTCWAASINMVANYYDVDYTEKEIRSVAFNGDFRAQRNSLNGTANTLARLLLNTRGIYTTSSLTQDAVREIINDDRPIMAGWGYYVNNELRSRHMVVIAGYTGNNNTDIGFLLYADPDPNVPNTLRYLPYSDFVRSIGNAGITRRWEESIYMQTRPPAIAQYIVGKSGIRNRTIMDAVNLSNLRETEVIHVITHNTGSVDIYEEQVIFDATKYNIIVTPTPGFPRPRIKSPGAIRVNGAREIKIDNVDIEGDSTVYNAGLLRITNGTITAASNYAIKNVGTIELSNNIVVRTSATSSCAVYNAGYVGFLDATITSASDTAIYNTGDIDIVDGILSTASNNNGVAIYNSNPNGTLYLGGNPTITGRIAGFGAWNTAIITGGIYAFRPTNKKYTLDPDNLKNGDVVVIYGANFLNNFELADTNFVLINNGGHLIAKRVNCTVKFDLDGGIGIVPADIIVSSGSRLTAGQMPSTENFSKTDYINDGKWYTISNSRYSEFIFGANGTPVTDNTTLYLQWSGMNTVTFNLNGGIGIVPTDIVVSSGSRLTADQMPSPLNFTRIGYINDGKWYTVSGSTYTEFVFGTNGTPVTGNTTLFLKWTVAGGITTYTVNFNLNGGTGTVPANIAVSSGGRLNGGQMPSTKGITKTGYINDGKWYTISDSEYREFIFGGNGTPVTSDITLYLRWTASTGTTEPTVPPAVSNEFSIGPNPVSRQGGAVNFYWQGSPVKNAKIDIFDASGNRIAKIKIGDDKKLVMDGGKRQVGSWDLKTTNGRSVSVGTYAIIGTISTTDAKNVSVSAVLSVR